MNKPKYVVHAYPVYVADWRNSETRMTLTLGERAVLWELIFYCATEGSAPTDPAVLCKIVNCTREEFDLAWPNVGTKFTERDGRLHHDRVDAELARITESRDRAVRAGRNGATRRWGGHSTPIATPSETDSSAIAPPIAPPMRFDSYPDPNPNPNPDPAIVSRARDNRPVETRSSNSSPDRRQSSQNAHGSIGEGRMNPRGQLEETIEGRGDSERRREICEATARRHPNSARSASAEVISRALISAASSDDEWERWDGFHREYSDACRDPKYCTRVTELIATGGWKNWTKRTEAYLP